MKRLRLWLTVGFVFGFFSGGFAKPTKAQLDSLEALQPELISTPVTLGYDSLGKYAGAPFVDSTNYWIALRFTDTAGTVFNLTAIFFKVDNNLINLTNGCTLIVAQDANHRPGTRIRSIFVGAPLPSDLRSAAVNPSIPILPKKDFWILLGPVPGGPYIDTLTDIGWWGLHDSLPSVGRSFISFNGNSWDSLGHSPLPRGNWGIRAGGSYSSPPQVVINEVMFNADTLSTDSSRNHQWVELYNPGSVQITDHWKLVNGSGLGSYPLPDGVRFDSAAYFVVHFAPGTDDTDLSDGRGDIFSDSPGFYFDNKKDACGLYVNSAAYPSQYLDIVAWNLSNLSIDKDANGQTTLEHTPFSTRNKVWRVQPQGGIGPLLTVPPGTSIGRDKLSSNPISSSALSPLNAGNLSFLGGPDAAGPTMGRKNELPMDFDTSGISSPPVGTADWTVMLYMAADYGDEATSPDRWYYDILNQLERVVPTGPDSVNVVVLFDTRHARLPDGTGPFNATLEGALKTDFTDTVRNLHFITPGLNTGNGTTLANFITMARSSFRANHYVLALKGDGAGWQGLCEDATDSVRLEMGTLKTALQSGLGSDILDLLILDAPLMSQIEVAAQVQPFAKFVIASPEMTGPADFDYSYLIEQLKVGSTILADPLSTRSFIGQLVDRLDVRTRNNPFAFWAAFDMGLAGLLNSLGSLITKVDSLAQVLQEGTKDPCKRGDKSDNFQTNVVRRFLLRSHHYGTQAQGMADFVDLYSFAKNLRDSSASFLGSCSPDPKDKAALVAGPFDLEGTNYDFIVAKFRRDYENPSQRPFNLGGLSIYFPSSRQRVVPIPAAKEDSMYNDTSDHPFDIPEALSLPGWAHVYAADAGACYPHADSSCDSSGAGTLPQNWPHPPVQNFSFADSTHWDEFLIRYYKPVADAGLPLTKKLNETFTINASGTSDPDDDVLRYFWDVTPNDAKPTCPDSLDDLDRNCVDDGRDEADFSSSSPVLTYAFTSPSVHPVWLYVWDNRDPGKPWYARGYNTSRDTTNVQIRWKSVQLVSEDLNVTVKPVYTTALGRMTIPYDDHPGLDDPTIRINAPVDEFTSLSYAGKPHIIWSTGSINSQTFPPACQLALDSALRTDSMGAWVLGQSIGMDGPAQAYFDLKGITVSSGKTSAVSLSPVADANQFLRGLSTVQMLPGGQMLESLTASSGAFPILRTNTGFTVAAAKVLEPSKHGLVYFSFGLEQLQNTADIDSLMARVLGWLSNPVHTTPPQPCLACTLLVRPRGDMNCDGVFSPADAVKLLNCAFVDSTCCDLSFSDINCDGTLSPADVVVLLKEVFLDFPPPCTALAKPGGQPVDATPAEVVEGLAPKSTHPKR